MTGKSAFTEEEWQAVLEGPPTAGMLVLTAERGGTFRETFAMAKAYAEAREQHGESELLDEILSARPQFDRDRYSTPQALEQEGPERLRKAVAVLEQKATPEDVEAFRAFVVELARRVAVAHEESGESVSAAEQAALDRIADSLGTQGPRP
jgi:chromatin segregation and condensation protein Rec8/ScpA/Scc1 (kleisin family)